MTTGLIVKLTRNDLSSEALEGMDILLIAESEFLLLTTRMFPWVNHTVARNVEHLFILSAKLQKSSGLSHFHPWFADCNQLAAAPVKLHSFSVFFAIHGILWTTMVALTESKMFTLQRQMACCR